MTTVGARRRGRELAVQALYQMELTGDETAASSETMWRHFSEPETARAFAGELLEGVVAQRQQIDGLISASCQHWRLGRLSNVDRAILRVGTYELLRHPEVPTSVVIDEAIEIAKRFGSEESGMFVNGVLDQIATAVGAKEGRGAV